MSHYTFKETCTVCDGIPSYNGHGMCDVCCSGEAGLMWDWVDAIMDSELDGAVDYIFHHVLVEPLMDKKGNINSMAAALMHIDQNVLDGFERIVDRQEKPNG